MEKSELQLNVENLILGITSCPDYINDEDPDGWLNLCKPIEKLNGLKNNPTEYKLGMAVYHKDVYNGHEALEIVGIREHELELRGNYSGIYNIIDDRWLPIEGVLLKKITTKEDRLEQCQVEEHTKQYLENWQKNNPMCVMCFNIPEDMEDGPIYNCWIYYSDGWGYNYASLCKYEKIIENG